MFKKIKVAIFNNIDMAIKPKIKNKNTVVAEKKVRKIQNKKDQKKVDKFFDKNIALAKSKGPSVSMTQEKKMRAATAPVFTFEVETQEKKPLFSLFSGKMLLSFFVGFLLLGMAGISVFFYYQYKKAVAVDAGKNELESYVSKIGTFMVLPENEQPTMATVADKERLSQQAFFAKAENGDKMLFYAKAQKAILYRPSQNKIIEATSMTGSVPVANAQSEVVPVENKPVEQVPAVASESTPTAALPEVKKQVTVIVNNGTVIKGLAKILAEKISQIEGASIVKTGNALGNFEKTIVVDVSGNNVEFAAEIAEKIGGEVGALPSGETVSGADILVIGGKEQAK